MKVLDLNKNFTITLFKIQIPDRVRMQFGSFLAIKVSNGGEKAKAYIAKLIQGHAIQKLISDTQAAKQSQS